MPSHLTWKWVGFTHSVPRNEAVVLHGCAHATRGRRPSFHKLYFFRSGKHNQTETSFKTNVPSYEGRELYHFQLHCVAVQIGENIMAFWSVRCRLFVNDESKHKVNNVDDGWVLDSALIGEEESDIVSESDGNTAMLTVEMWTFLLSFSCPTPTLLLLAPVLLGLGETDHSEILGTERVNQIKVGH